MSVYVYMSRRGGAPAAAAELVEVPPEDDGTRPMARRGELDPTSDSVSFASLMAGRGFRVVFTSTNYGREVDLSVLAGG